MNTLPDDDFGDSLDDMISGAAAAIRSGKPLAVTPPASYKPAAHVETCPACRGTGKFRSYTGRLVGECFKCKGKGSRTFKASAEQRGRNRANAQARKAAKAEEAIEAFKAAHPAIWSWMDGNTFEFAVAMREAVAKWGDLTEKQLAACYNCVAKLEAAKARRQEARAASEKAASAVSAAGVDRLKEAFDRAAASRLRSPRITIGGVVISPAPAHGKNPGALYVKDGETYLGKVAGGRFFASRECTPETETKVLAFVADPRAAAEAYGQETGTCCICNATLTNKESIARGIGPICAEKFGW